MSHLTAVYGMFGERDWRWSIAWEDPTVEPLLGDFTDDELSELCALRERMLRHMPDRDEGAYLTLDARGRVRMEARWADLEACQAERGLELLDAA